MFRIEEIDTNMKTEHTLAPEIKAEYDFYDAEKPPFSIHGVFREGDKLVRLPKAVAEGVSDGVGRLYHLTVGGRIRFRTNSRRIAIAINLPLQYPDSRNALTAISGLDLYAEENGVERYFGTINPPLNYKGGFEGQFLQFPDDKMRTVTINLPRGNTVHKLYIGVKKGSSIEAAPEFAEPPVVYYGSSITQGGCSSRPGLTYQAIIHRNINLDYINLGFSGSARGEEAIMEYISGLSMSMFVYDYDHNAPSVQHLKETHFKGYEKVRKAHPDIPIIMLTRPKFYLEGDEMARLEVIKESYRKALANGDNVYFIDGREMMDEEIRENALIDHCHPTDCGFFGMARRILPVMREAMGY